MAQSRQAPARGRSAAQELIGWLDRRKLDAVIHLGAISTPRPPTATSSSPPISASRSSCWTGARRRAPPFLYASSAATYGDGAEGFDDEWTPAALRRLKPMNLYGFSKHLFDLAIVDRFAKGLKLPPQWVGLKFFNVFGPNDITKAK
jgi:ADP-L-glycero-D-manno-heptose 6-epimerase